jgi:hypothetical protein
MRLWQCREHDCVLCCAVLLLLFQGLRVYEQGRLLSDWQDQLSDAVQAQLQAMFQGLSGHFSQLAKPTVGWAAYHGQQPTRY